jgi:phosphosulfolactate synthase (CoM biosynthesis protein A)
VEWLYVEGGGLNMSNKELTNDIEKIVDAVFMAGYNCGKKETGFQMVLVGDIIKPQARKAILSVIDVEKTKSKLDELTEVQEQLKTLKNKDTQKSG